MHTGFWCGNPKERDDSGDTGTDGRIILQWILERWNLDSMYWINVAQIKDKWWNLVNAVINFQVP
jgi:hypothetical protein